MTKPTRLAALYLAIVFVAGALFGFVGHNLYSQRSTRASNPNPREFRDRYIAKLTERLSLTPDQVTQVTAILDQTGDQFRHLRERIEPEFDAIRQEQRQRIMAILKSEQQPKYQQIIEEWKARHNKAPR